MADAVLLEQGLVVDGTGGPSWPGDVLLVGERIERVGAGLRERLPDGLPLATWRGRLPRPSHRARLHRRAHPRRRDRAARPGLPAQAVAGHHDGDHRQLRHLARAVRAPKASAAADAAGRRSFRYPTWQPTRDAVQAAQPALNVARVDRSHDAALRGDERPDARGQRRRTRAMAALLDACMADGAIGLSSGLFYEEALPRRPTR